MAIIDMLLQAESLFSGLSSYLNQIVIALVIILFGFVIGKIVESLLRQLLAKLNTDDRLSKLFGARRNYARAIRRTIARIIYLVTIVIALQKLSLIGAVLNVLVILAIVVILISFVLAGLDIVPQVAARASLRHKKVIVGDDVVFTGDAGVIHGTIVDITLTDVRIRRKNGDIMFIPNAVFLRESITKRKKSA